MALSFSTNSSSFSSLLLVILVTAALDSISVIIVLYSPVNSGIFLDPKASLSIPIASPGSLVVLTLILCSTRYLGAEGLLLSTTANTSVFATPKDLAPSLL